MKAFDFLTLVNPQEVAQAASAVVWLIPLLLVHCSVHTVFLDYPVIVVITTEKKSLDYFLNSKLHFYFHVLTHYWL